VLLFREGVGPPGPEAGVARDHPVAFLQCLYVRSDGRDLEDPFVAADGGRGWCAEEGGEGWFGGVDALDLVYVCGVDGCGEGAKEEGGGREGWRYRVCVEAVMGC
jgi:hypothetical protein